MSNHENINVSLIKDKVEILIYQNRLRIQGENTTNDKIFCKQIINDIIYNEKAHIVAVFKDYLIYDDTSEFLKRSYKLHETKSRLLKIFEFYDSYSKIFPNYTVMSEAKYIYKNIQRKQKMIDNIHKKNNRGKIEKIDQSQDDKIFITDVYNSIMNLTVSTMKADENKFLNNNNHYKEKIGRKELNLSINIDESNQSLECLIDNIGKAEEIIYKPIKYQANMKKPPSTTKESRLQLNTLRKHSGKNSQANFNQFNKKTDFMKPNNKKKLDFSPNVKMNNTKGKDSMNGFKNPSPNARAVFKSIQFNDKLNIHSLLESVNQNPNLNHKKESFHTRSSIADDRKPAETERGNKKQVSHKVTLSIPKTTTNNHIYNNFNIINNFHAGDANNNNPVIPYSRINIISELSPKINSARVIQNFEIKQEERTTKMADEINKTKKVNTSHSVQLNNNGKEDKNSQIVRLRKNHTKSNFVKQIEGRSNATSMSNLKVNLLKTNSAYNNPLSSKTILKLNTIKTPSYINENNSISMTKRDCVAPLTARQFIREDSTNVKIIQGKTSEEGNISQNINSPIPVKYKHLNLTNTTRLIKNSISNGQLSKGKFNVNNVSERNKELASPKLIKRNKSETYKAFNQSKGGDASNLNLENNKPPNLLKKKSQKNFSLENKAEISTTSKVRLNSAKTATLSPKKNSTILTKSSTFKPSEVLQKEMKLKQIEQVKSYSKIKTLSTNSASVTKSNSSRVKRRVEENRKSPIICLK